MLHFIVFLKFYASPLFSFPLFFLFSLFLFILFLFFPFFAPHPSECRPGRITPSAPSVRHCIFGQLFWPIMIITVWYTSHFSRTASDWTFMVQTDLFSIFQIGVGTPFPAKKGMGTPFDPSRSNRKWTLSMPRPKIFYILSILSLAPPARMRRYTPLYVRTVTVRHHHVQSYTCTSVHIAYTYVYTLKVLSRYYIYTFILLAYYIRLFCHDLYRINYKPYVTFSCHFFQNNARNKMPLTCLIGFYCFCTSFYTYW